MTRRQALLRGLMNRVLAAARSGRFRLAESLAGRLIALEPRCHWGYFYRAGLRLARGEASAAAEDLRRLEGLPPELALFLREPQLPPPVLFEGLHRGLAALGAAPGPWARLLEAFAFRAEKRLPECLRSVDQAVAAAPAQPVVLAFAARLRYLFQLPEQGVRDMERAWRLAPRCPWICAWLGEVRRYGGRLREAHRLLNRALKGDPDYYLAYSWRGKVRRDLGMPREALRDLDVAIRREFVPGDLSLAWAYHERSLVRRELGDWRGVFPDLARAHRLNQRYTWAGDRDRRAGPLQSALALDELLRRHPRSAWARAWRGFLHRSEGRPGPAVEDLDAALRLNPRLAWGYAWRGSALHDLGRLDSALRDCERALRLDPRYGFAWALKARLLGALGRWRQAASAAARACALDRVCATQWAFRAEAALRLARPREASEFVAEALALDPSYQDARRLRERIAAGAR